MGLRCQLRYLLVLVSTLFSFSAAALVSGFSLLSLEPASGYFARSNKKQWLLPELPSGLQTGPLANPVIEEQTIPDIILQKENIYSDLILNVHFFPLPSVEDLPLTLYLKSQEEDQVSIINSSDSVSVSSYGSFMEVTVGQKTAKTFYIHWQGVDGVRLDVFWLESELTGRRQFTMEIPEGIEAGQKATLFSKTHEARPEEFTVEQSYRRSGDSMEELERRSRKQQQERLDKFLDAYFGDYIWVGPPEEYWKAHWLSGGTRLATVVCIYYWDNCGGRQTGSGRVHHENWQLVMGNPVPGSSELARSKKKKKKVLSLTVTINLPSTAEPADHSEVSSQNEKTSIRPGAKETYIPPKRRWLQEFASSQFELLETQGEIPEVVVSLINTLVTVLNQSEGSKADKCMYTQEHSPHLYLLVVAAVHYYLELGKNNEQGAKILSTYVQNQELLLFIDDAIALLDDCPDPPNPVVPESGMELSEEFFNTNWERARSILKALSNTKAGAPEEPFLKALAHFSLVLFLAPSLEDIQRKQFVLYLDTFKTITFWRTLINWPEVSKPEPAERALLSEPEPQPREKEVKQISPPVLPPLHPIYPKNRHVDGLIVRPPSGVDRYWPQMSAGSNAGRGLRPPLLHSMTEQQKQPSVFSPGLTKGTCSSVPELPSGTTKLTSQSETAARGTGDFERSAPSVRAESRSGYPVAIRNTALMPAPAVAPSYGMLTAPVNRPKPPPPFYNGMLLPSPDLVDMSLFYQSQQEVLQSLQLRMPWVSECWLIRYPSSWLMRFIALCQGRRTQQDAEYRFQQMYAQFMSKNRW